MDLRGRTALVTGAGVRIGRALALGLAAEGCRVVVHYHTSRAAADEAVAAIEAAGGEALAVGADLRDLEALPGLVETAVATYGALDVLINSAAIFERGTLLETTPDDWERHFAVNLRAPFFLAQAYARRLGPAQRGHIINLADWRATRPGSHYMAYILTKSALLTLTQSLAIALGPQVQVNAIAPGAILPPPGGNDGYFERTAARIPARRVGSPDEIVRAALYLLSSDFVTGETLYVTGGEHLI
jgi:pteridine reductase